MNKKKLVKRLLVIPTLVTLVFSIEGIVHASTQALPNGTIVNQNGAKYLTDSKGEKYSGWFIDSKDDWYYFKDSDKVMKTGWHQDNKDGYFYYLSLSDGKMVTGWNTINGKEYFFQPVRDMGNYHFNNKQEKWLYSINSKVPYGALYVNTSTPDGSKVDETGAKIMTSKTSAEGVGASKMVKDGWILEDGRWYYYQNNEIAKSKWVNLNGKWYYLKEDGSMLSNGWHEVGGQSYFFGSDGTLYVNTITPDGVKVDQDGIKITIIAVKEIINHKFVSKDDLETYQWWEKNGDMVRADSRISGTAADQSELFSELYPEIPGRGAWDEYEFSSNEWYTESSFGVGGHGFGGTITWESETSALLKADHVTSEAKKVKIIDKNTIKIDGESYVLVD